jgi:hypothetical protein
VDELAQGARIGTLRVRAGGVGGRRAQKFGAGFAEDRFAERADAGV